MIGLPADAPISDTREGTLTFAWKRWFSELGRLLTAIQFLPVTDIQTPVSGFSYQATSNASKLILTPAGTLASGTVTLPKSPADGMEWRLSSTQAITALTLSAPSGFTVLNAPTTLAAGVGVGYTYSGKNSTWYRLY